MIIHIKRTKLSLGFPDEYEVAEGSNIQKKIENSHGNIAAYQKFTSNANCTVFVQRLNPIQLMKLDDKQGLINGIHDHIDENQGLIVVENGVTARGYRYIYSIVRTVESNSCVYLLCMHMEHEGEAVQVKAEFQETGMTGIRENVGQDMARRAGLIYKPGEYYLAGWRQDPYDPTFLQGMPMNLSEKEDLDARFPEHPLSQARDLVRSLIDDTAVLEEEKRIAEEEAKAEALRIAEEERKAAEEQRIAEEKRRIEEAQRAEEERRIAAEKKAAEEKRIAEEKKAAEERALEEKRLADERKALEEQKAAEERALLERAEREKAVASMLSSKGTSDREADPISLNAVYGTFNKNAALLQSERARAMDLLNYSLDLVCSFNNRPVFFDAELQSIDEARNHYRAFDAKEYVSTRLNTQEHDAETVKKNIMLLKEANAKIEVYLQETNSSRENLSKVFRMVIKLSGRNFAALSEDDKFALMTIVNHAKNLSMTLTKSI